MGCYKLFNLENNSVLCFYYNKICDTNFTDPVPACAGMTGKENKCVFLNSLTTLALRATPPQRGTYSATERTKFPSIGGVFAGRGGHCFPHPPTV